MAFDCLVPVSFFCPRFPYVESERAVFTLDFSLLKIIDRFVKNSWMWLFQQTEKSLRGVRFGDTHAIFYPGDFIIQGI